MGAMPPGLMFSMLRGFDMIALITLPIVFSLPVWVSIIIAVIAFSFLRSGFDREALMEQQAEQKRVLDAEKARRAGTSSTPVKKVQVQRKTR